jgi:hypothetical protein
MQNQVPLRVCSLDSDLKRGNYRSRHWLENPPLDESLFDGARQHGLPLSPHFLKSQLRITQFNHGVEDGGIITTNSNCHGPVGKDERSIHESS